MYEFYLIMDVEKTYVNINLIVLYAKTNIIIASILYSRYCNFIYHFIIVD